MDESSYGFCLLQVAFFASQQPPRLIVASPPAGVPLSAVLSQALASFLGLPPAAPFDALLAPLLASPQMTLATGGTSGNAPDRLAEFGTEGPSEATEPLPAVHTVAGGDHQVPGSQVWHVLTKIASREGHCIVAYPLPLKAHMLPDTVSALVDGGW